jgi:uncharacterized repeat protein (TIGR01451 family)
LACYGDDETTDVADGARPGAAITFRVDGLPTAALPLRFNGKTVPAGQGLAWTAMGDRWEVELGAPPVVDVAIAKTVKPQVAMPGTPITYSLTYSNVGSLPAQSVVITDQLPLEIIAPEFTEGGEVIEAEGSRTITWHVADLGAGAGGAITVTGRLSPALIGLLTITNP